jgi:NifU-like protein involved in Fe-S cluster formation
MAELNDIYSTRLLDIAANMARTKRLDDPDVTATAHSKLCGSTITVDMAFEGDTIADYGQTVKACLLGQASASIVGREIVGVSIAEIQDIGRIMRRHASTLLVFEAIDKAIAAHRARDEMGAAANA